MSEGISAITSACRIFKVGLTIPVHDQVSHCVGLGAGPSEDAFREWLHRRIMLSRMPFLWAEVEPLRMHEGRDLERQLHLLTYASGCSPRRQVFWSGDGSAPVEAQERFLQSIIAGEGPPVHDDCAMLLAGRAVADMKLTAGVPAEDSFPEENRENHSAPARLEPMPWTAVMLAMFGAVRRRIACLWMW